mgnify:FL=1
MATIQISSMHDGQLANISYRLRNEKFLGIKGRSYSADSNSDFIASKNTVAHSTADFITGSFNMTISINELKEKFGVTDLGIMIATIETEIRGNSQPAYKNAYALFGSSLDCCMADKLYASLECDCNDDSCNQSLFDAQKIFLFKKSAEYVLRTIVAETMFEADQLDALAVAKLQDATAKYNKSLELCSSGCNC